MRRGCSPTNESLQPAPEQIRKHLAAGLHLLQEQAQVLQLVFVRRVLKQDQALFIGLFEFVAAPQHAQTLQCVGIGEDQAIAECELGVVAIVGEHYVAQLMSQNCRQSRLVGSASIKPRLTTMVWPIAKLSIGAVSSTRHRTSVQSQGCW